MHRTLTLSLSLASIALAVILLLVSVTGLLWPATPVGDVGMLSVVVVFALLGVVGLLLLRAQPAT